jgi:hypothetical protein
MRIDDTARPRHYALDADYRIEVDYVRAEPASGTPAHIAALDVIDYEGQSIDDDDLFELASELTSYAGDCVEDALDALLGFALALDDAERSVAIWEEALASDLESPLRLVVEDGWDRAAFIAERFTGASRDNGADTGVYVINWTASGSTTTYVYQWDNDTTANVTQAAELALVGIVNRGTTTLVNADIVIA